MNRFKYYLVLLGFAFLSLTSCKKDADFSNIIEFRPMLFRPDSSYYTCVKYVPELGHSVPIQGNAYVNILENSYGIGMYNFTDTTLWKEYEFSAYLNELMGASYCELKVGKVFLGGNNVIVEDCIEGTCSLGKWNQDIPLASYDE